MAAVGTGAIVGADEVTVDLVGLEVPDVTGIVADVALLDVDSGVSDVLPTVVIVLPPGLGFVVLIVKAVALVATETVVPLLGRDVKMVC